MAHTHTHTHTQTHTHTHTHTHVHINQNIKVHDTAGAPMTKRTEHSFQTSLRNFIEKMKYK